MQGSKPQARKKKNTNATAGQYEIGHSGIEDFFLRTSAAFFSVFCSLKRILLPVRQLKTCKTTSDIADDTKKIIRLIAAPMQ